MISVEGLEKVKWEILVLAKLAITVALATSLHILISIVATVYVMATIAIAVATSTERCAETSLCLLLRCSLAGGMARLACLTRAAFKTISTSRQPPSSSSSTAQPMAQ